MRKSFIIAFIFAALLSCSTGKGEKKSNTKDSQVQKNEISVLESNTISNKNQVNPDLVQYLQNFKNGNLPLEYKACTQNAKGLYEFDGKKFNQFIKEYSFSYRQIPTNGPYLATITRVSADCLIPVLTTFKRSGEIIDQKMFAIGYCGFDCGYNCAEYMRISKDFEIFTSDTISKFDCDSLGDEIPGTYQHYVVYKEGKLLKNGKIQLSDEIEKTLKGRKII